LALSDFKGYRIIITIFLAACLTFLTLGTVSVYGIPDTAILPAGFLAIISAFSLILIYLRIKYESIN